jgi:hypothetical protein
VAFDPLFIVAPYLPSTIEGIQPPVSPYAKLLNWVLERASQGMEDGVNPSDGD